MDFFEYIKNFKLAVDELRPEIVTFMEQQGEEMKGIVKTRAFSGQSANDGVFSKYSSRSHKAKRKKAGLSISKKDFKFTGSMWDNFKLDKGKTVSTTEKVSVTIGFDNNKANTIADRHSVVERNRGVLGSDKDGKQSIVSITKQEKENFTKKVNKFLGDYFKRKKI